MSQVTISSEYQIQIPKEVVENLNLSFGAKLAIFAYNGKIELIPLKPIRSLRGFLTGMSIENVREKDRHL